MKRAMPRALGRSSTAIKASHDFEMDQSRAGKAGTAARPGDIAQGATEPPVSSVAGLLDLSKAAFPPRGQSFPPPSRTPRQAAPSQAPAKQSLLPFGRPACAPRPRPQTAQRMNRRPPPTARPTMSRRRSRPRRRPGQHFVHVTSPACRRREGQGPRHHRRHPHAQADRARAPPGHARRAAGTRPLRRLRAGRPVDLSRPGHRPLQGRRLAGPRRRARMPALARGIRQRQAHHLQRLLHLAHRHRGHARGPRPPRRARERHRARAGLRHRQFHGPCPAGHAVHRRRAGLPLRPHRPRASPRRTTSASRTSATRSCPRAASTP